MESSKFISTEISELSSHSDVIPFCVYHFVDKKQGVYHGYISPPELYNHVDGPRYKCGPPPQTNGWEKKFIFYAINPMINPIPFGMALFCANRRVKYPYDTTTVKFSYDPYNIKDSCVYFIAYTKGVEHSTPIFTHVLRDKNIAFPSLDPNPPVHSLKNYFKKIDNSEGRFTIPHYELVGDSHIRNTISESSDTYQKWSEEDIFPFFVLSPEKFGKKYWDIKFICNNGRCLPHLPGKTETKPIISSGKLVTHSQTPQKLSKCVVHCNIAVNEFIGGGEPYDLIGIINRKINNMNNVNTLIEGTPPIAMAILVCALVVIIGILLSYYIFKK